MRIFVLAASLFISGCHAEAEVDWPSPTPSPTPIPSTPTLSPSPAPSTLAPTPAATSEPSQPPGESPSPRPEKISYEGTWTTTDAQGQIFDIVIFQSGQAVSNWTKGPTGARGERGYWRSDEHRLTIVYSDGCTDTLEPTGNGFLHRRYSAGSPLNAKPIAESEARRTESSQQALIGVWRLNKEPDGSHLYIALQSNGNAVSTINGVTAGKWTANQKGALCEWPDGWVDQIERGSGGWQKRSWIGSEISAPADLSPATRVGETRFSVEP